MADEGAPAGSRPILIVDDDEGQRSLLQSFLGGQGYAVFAARSGGEGAAILEDRPEIAMLISDVRMPGMTGFDLLRRAREIHPKLPVLLVTAYADIRGAVEAMRDGAVDYLEKPIDLDELLAFVREIAGGPGNAPAVPAAELDLPPGVIAESPAVRDVFGEAALVAGSESRILITGESGSGKEILADLIHQWSPRANKPLVKVNCAAIPETLLESELFGHERGAFTGATHQRIGRFEEAHGGTILLDEIGEIPPLLQAKLLRIIQDGEFQRVGSNRPRAANARVLASTNRNLEREVEEGRFREDLFFRLNVMELYMPPLRERREDIQPLAHHFVKFFSEGNPRFSPIVIEWLHEYDWPGNVRELRNAMERASLMARGDLIIPEHLPKRIAACFRNREETGGGERRKLEDIEREAILRALRQNGNNRTETARELGISRRALTYKVQRYIKEGYLRE